MTENNLEIKKASDRILYVNKSKKAVILHKNQSIRSSLVNTLNNLGVSTINISICSGNSYDELSDLLVRKEPEIVICPSVIGDDDFKEILKMHEQIHPNRLSATFVIVSEDGSLAGGITKIEYFIDGYLVIPFTPQGINNSLLTIFEEKYEATKGQIAFNAARAEFIKEKYEEAQRLFQRAAAISEVRGVSYSFLGRIEEMNNNKEAALDYPKKGWVQRFRSYHCLSNLVRLNMELGYFDLAYSANQSFLKKYPVYPDHFPRIIKLAVATKNYDDILNLANFVSQAHLYSSAIQSYLAAGLVMGGRFLFENGRDEDALKAIDNALKANNSVNILKRSLSLVCQHYFKKDALQILEKYADEKTSEIDFLEMQLDIFFQFKDYSNALKTGQKLLDLNVKDSSSYCILIKSAVAADLSKERVESIIEKAAKRFPEKLNDFNLLAN